jgi:hypothetical protein
MSWHTDGQHSEAGKDEKAEDSASSSAHSRVRHQLSLRGGRFAVCEHTDRTVLT